MAATDTLAPTIVAPFLVSLDTTMLFAAFDPLRHAFAGALAADLSWVLNAYTVVYATMLILAGGLADTLAFGTAFSMMFLTFFFYMMNVWHFSLPQAGLAVRPGPLLVMPTAIVTGRLATRLGHRRFLVGGRCCTPAAACGSSWCRGRKHTTWRTGCPVW